MDSRDDITSNPEPKGEFTFDVLRLEGWKVPVSLTKVRIRMLLSGLDQDLLVRDVSL